VKYCIIAISNQYKKEKKMQNISTYLTNLITEKGQDIYAEVEREGHFGLTWKHLIDFCEQINPKDQSKIIENCTIIDFKNGDVFHFLNFLIDGMIKSL
jgi:hypothetical protein